MTQYRRRVCAVVTIESEIRPCSGGTVCGGSRSAYPPELGKYIIQRTRPRRDEGLPRTTNLQPSNSAVDVALSSARVPLLIESCTRPPRPQELTASFRSRSVPSGSVFAFSRKKCLSPKYAFESVSRSNECESPKRFQSFLKNSRAFKVAAYPRQCTGGLIGVRASSRRVPTEVVRDSTVRRTNAIRTN